MVVFTNKDTKCWVKKLKIACLPLLVQSKMKNLTPLGLMFNFCILSPRFYMKKVTFHLAWVVPKVTSILASCSSKEKICKGQTQLLGMERGSPPALAPWVCPPCDIYKFGKSIEMIHTVVGTDVGFSKSLAGPPTETMMVARRMESLMTSK